MLYPGEIAADGITRRQGVSCPDGIEGEKLGATLLNVTVD
jgi:hypothetical protein